MGSLLNRQMLDVQRGSNGSQDWKWVCLCKILMVYHLFLVRMAIFESKNFAIPIYSHTQVKTSRPRQEAETDNFAKANPVDVAELRARINVVVPTKDGSVERQQATCLGSRRLHNMEVPKIQVIN